MPRRRPPSRTVATVPVLVVLWCGAATIGPLPTAGAATACSSGKSVCGTVTDALGAAVPSLAVRLYDDATGTTVPSIGKTYTNSSGRYSFPAIAAGSYHVRFGPDTKVSGGPEYVLQWNGGSATEATAPSLHWAPGDQIVVDATLQQAGRVSGQVAQHDGGAPLGPVTVRLYAPAGSTVAKTTTGADGSYRLDHVAPGSYLLRFGGDTFTPIQWYPGVATRTSATVLTVAGGTSTTANLTLPAGWTVTPTPNPSSGQSELLSTSCVSSSWCVAVGYTYTTIDRLSTLVEVWNGSSWTIVPSPNLPGAPQSLLLGVSCSSVSACVAVGYGVVNGTERNLVEVWNGTSWRVVTAPNRGAGTNTLTAVDCVSPTSCFMAGFDYEYRSTPQGQVLTIHSLMAHWEGTTVVVDPSEDPARFNRPAAIDCVSSMACVTVGAQQLDSGLNRTLIESWDGTSWKVVPSPNPTTMNLELTGVSCPSATTCTAVGDFQDPTIGGRQHTLIEHWDGTAWTIVPSPDSFSATNVLQGVGCPTAGSCTAVGFASDPTHDAQTLLLAWNGSTWSTTPGPQPGTSSRLRSIDCTSEAVCVAVGSTGDAVRTLAAVRR